MNPEGEYPEVRAWRRRREGERSGRSDEERGGTAEDPEQRRPPTGGVAVAAADPPLDPSASAVPSPRKETRKRPYVYRPNRVRRLCDVSSCPNQAVRGGVCVRHGASRTAKFCSVAGCASKARRLGRCARHGGGRGKGAPSRPERRVEDGGRSRARRVGSSADEAEGGSTIEGAAEGDEEADAEGGSVERESSSGRSEGKTDAAEEDAGEEGGSASAEHEDVPAPAERESDDVAAWHIGLSLSDDAGGKLSIERAAAHEEADAGGGSDAGESTNDGNDEAADAAEETDATIDRNEGTADAGEEDAGEDVDSAPVETAREDVPAPAERKLDDVPAFAKRKAEEVPASAGRESKGRNDARKVAAEGRAGGAKPEEGARRRKRRRRACSAEGCANLVRSGDRCMWHGAKPKVSREVRDLEMCAAVASDDGEVRAGRVVASAEERAKLAVCGREKRATAEPTKPAFCTWEGCKNHARLRGVCYTHGARHGDRLCQSRGCPNVAPQSGGLCARHEEERCSAEARAKKRVAAAVRAERLSKRLDEMEGVCRSLRAGLNATETSCRLLRAELTELVQGAKEGEDVADSS